MPEQATFLPRQQLLTYEEIFRFVGVAARMGITRLRITGGEPLVRSDLSRLIKLLRAIPGIQDIGLTTNGILLEEHAEALRSAGLSRVNISLDTLDETTFFNISRREGLDRVLAGIQAARSAGFARIRLNAIAIRDLTESEILPLVTYARKHQLELRFIEFMPLDADANWQSQDVLDGATIRQRIEEELGPLRPVPPPDPGQPASDFEFADGGRIGFINPVSQPFCDRCNRLRLTSEGKVRNCLFATEEWDARALLRNRANDTQIAQLIRQCVLQKRESHGIDDATFQRPERAMYQIGG